MVGIADDPLEAAVCVFHVRRGRIVGRRAFIVDKVEDLTRPQLVGRVLEQLYGDAEPPSGSRPAAPERATRGTTAGMDLGGGRPGQWGTDGRRRSAACPARCSCPSCPTTPTPTRPSWPTAAAARWRCGCPQRGGKRALHGDA